MNGFRFRAQAALDLRQRELEEKQRDLARIERDREAAGARLRDAEAARTAARTRSAQDMPAATSIEALERYRFWNARLDRECEALRAGIRALDAEVTRAAAACRDAERRRRPLARLKEKGQDAYDVLQQAGERRTLDEVAAHGFMASRAERDRNDRAEARRGETL